MRSAPVGILDPVGEQGPVEGGGVVGAVDAGDLLAGGPADDADAGGVGVGQQVGVERRRAAAGEAHRRAAGGLDLDAGAGERVEAGLGDDVAPGGRVVAAARAGRRDLGDGRRGGHQDGHGDQRGRVGRAHEARARGQAADGRGGVAAPHRRQDDHQRPAQAEGREAGGRDGRVAEGEGAGAGDEEGRDRQARQQAQAEAGAVGERPGGQRPLAAPALGHLAGRAGDRDAQQARARGRPRPARGRRRPRGRRCGRAPSPRGRAARPGAAAARTAPTAKRARARR